ncbi:MAG TPA: hypothetical protein DCQ93_03880 [Bacteroidetes bacterium]|nr:hypothetical protein [Bacteroidota bacterium]
MKTKFCLVIFICLGIFETAYPQAGVLDSTFGTNGIGAFPFPLGAGYSVLVQNDGNILVGGNTANNSCAIARFKPNGTLDSSFGTNGKVTYYIDGHCQNAAMALQQDGKIVFSSTSTLGFALLRFNSNGTIDNSFNGSGLVISNFNTEGYSDVSLPVVIQDDGKIIQGGNAHDNSGVDHFGLIRLNPNGSIDNSFGISGRVMTLIGNPLPALWSLAVQSDGKILAGGYSESQMAAPSCFALARYNINGSLDAANFSLDGKVTEYFGLGGASGASLDYDIANAMSFGHDGRILMSGGSLLAGDTNSPIPIMKFNIDGSLDNTFGINGKIRYFAEPASFEINSIAVQIDGKILLCGIASYDLSGNLNDYCVARFESNGEIDSSFGTNGIAYSTLDSAMDMGYSIAIQADNKILITGYSFTHGMFVARYLPGIVNGLNDVSSEAIQPILTYPNPIHDKAIIEYTLEQNEKLSILLTDIHGKTVQAFITNETRLAGIHEEELHLTESLAAGTYIISISNGKNSQGVKVVKY